MRAWRRDLDAECNTLAGWIDDIVALRSDCHVGPDERVFLENGDDGATYTGDGTHPNAAGYQLTADEWRGMAF
jgi:lysophospholipase L1-like esterase